MFLFYLVFYKIRKVSLLEMKGFCSIYGDPLCRRHRGEEIDG